jgi:phenylalanine ammonia-lyase
MVRGDAEFLLNPNRRDGHSVIVDGRSLSLADVTAVARFGTPVELSASNDMRDAISSSRRVIEDKVRETKSVYGVSTGFGGSGEIFSRSASAYVYRS